MCCMETVSFFGVSVLNDGVYVLICIECLPGTPDRIEAVMDEVEKYMMLHLYEQAFCPESADDEVKDLAIQKRIR